MLYSKVVYVGRDHLDEIPTGANGTHSKTCPCGVDVTAVCAIEYETGACLCRYPCPHGSTDDESCSLCGRKADRKNIVLPGSLGEIREKTFYGTAEEAVHLPETVTYVGGMAFAESDSLKAVVFSGKDANIEDNAFEGSENSCILVPSGGAVETWARANNVPFIGK